MMILIDLWCFLCFLNLENLYTTGLPVEAGEFSTGVAYALALSYKNLAYPYKPLTYDPVSNAENL